MTSAAFGWHSRQRRVTACGVSSFPVMTGAWSKWGRTRLAYPPACFSGAADGRVERAMPTAARAALLPAAPCEGQVPAADAAHEIPQARLLEPVPCEPPLAPRGHEPVHAEDPELLRDDRLRDAERPREGGHVRLARGEDLDDSQPDRVGHGPQQVGVLPEAFVHDLVISI
jgi:hypothetical protein